MTRIELRDVTKYFHITTPESETADPPDNPPVQDNTDPTKIFAIENLNLVVPNNRILVILGPSGCGKSTLLRLIAGTMPVDSGEILFNGVDMANTPPRDRNIGMVFQNYALYPHQTSKQNILSYFSFREKTTELDAEAKEKYQRTSELMGVDIKHLLGRKPGTLSSGEQQRVAIARCITRNPQLFLMDEPFSNLDQKLRDRYRIQLKRLLREFRVTTIYVTHDQQVALSLADQIAVMNKGRIEQVGPPHRIYHLPENLFVADFLSFDQDTPAINLLTGETIREDLRGKTVGVRPEEIVITQEQADDSIQGRVVDIQSAFPKKEVVVSVNVAGQVLRTKLDENSGLELYHNVWVHFNAYHVFNKKSGRRVG